MHISNQWINNMEGPLEISLSGIAIFTGLNREIHCFSSSRLFSFFFSLATQNKTKTKKKRNPPFPHDCISFAEIPRMRRGEKEFLQTHAFVLVHGIVRQTHRRKSMNTKEQQQRRKKSAEQICWSLKRIPIPNRNGELWLRPPSTETMY